MKSLLRIPLLSLMATAGIFSAHAANNFTFNALGTFGGNSDGSIRPGDPAYNLDTASNQRGLACDPTSTNLVLVSPNSGGGGGPSSSNIVYVIDGNLGTQLGTLLTNGMVGGSYVDAPAAIADDGVVYVCNQVTVSTNNAFKIYRYNSISDVNPPSVAYSNFIPGHLAQNTAPQRYGQSIDIRGSGAGTQIIIGSMPGPSSTNVANLVIFTTADGLTFTANPLGVTNLARFTTVTNSIGDGGIAFGTGTNFWAKRIGGDLLYCSYDLTAKTARVITNYAATNMAGVANLGPIAVDNANNLLAAVEERNGTTAGGPERLFLYDISGAVPILLAVTNFVPDNPNTTAPLGYVRLCGGRCYAHVSNNGLLAMTVDSQTTTAPTFLTDLPPTNRVAVGTTAHFEVLALAGVTGYVWKTNNVVVTGANNYYLDILATSTNMSGIVVKVEASNAAGTTTSSNSVLSVVNPADLFHFELLWSFGPTDTNYFSNSGNGNVPNERSFAFNTLSNQLIVVKRNGVNVRMFVVDADTGRYLYDMKTNGLAIGGLSGTSGNIPLCAVAVAADGAVYACNSVLAPDQSFRVYRWADSGSNTSPVVIFGTNSPAASGNPFPGVTTAYFRTGDNLDVRGSGTSTEIIVDNQDTGTFRFVGVLRPTDGTMLNWAAKGFVLQNGQGGTGIGRSLQFGPTSGTFWQKRFQAGGAPLVQSSYNTSDPDPAQTTTLNSYSGLPLFTNGPMGINFALNLAAAVEFVGSGSAAAPDRLALYDVTAPGTPVLVDFNAFAVNETLNNNKISQVLMVTNKTTGTNYCFALNANNGIMGYALGTGPLPKPTFITNPKNQRVVVGTTVSLQVGFSPIRGASLIWQKDTGSGFTTIANQSNTTYTIANAQVSDGANYRAIATNPSGSGTSTVAVVSVHLSQDNYSLVQIWTASSNNASLYSSSDGGPNTPKERSIAYHSLSNQLLVVRNIVGSNPNVSPPEIHVVNGDTGVELYQLNTNGIGGSPSGINAESEVSGSNPLNLDAIGVADDGNIYACNEVPNASGGIAYSDTKLFRVYRWTNSDPATLPILIFSGDPSVQPTTNSGVNLRWGDVMHVRGSGINTEIILDEQTLGGYAAVLKPVDSTLNIWTNYPLATSPQGGTIGRSIQFQAGTNFWQKRKGADLKLSKFDTNTSTATLLNSYPNYPSTFGGVAIDNTRMLAIGPDFTGAATTPDVVALYQIVDPTTPMRITTYNYPISPALGNVNFICSTAIGNGKVYSLDGNNGIAAFRIAGPKLTIVQSGSNVIISWSTDSPGAVLQSTGSLSSPSWADVGTAVVTVGTQYTVTQAIGSTAQFYRLR